MTKTLDTKRLEQNAKLLRKIVFAYYPRPRSRSILDAADDGDSGCGIINVTIVRKFISWCWLLLPFLLIPPPVHAALDFTATIQRAPLLDPTATPFPDASLVDRATEQEAPAGKHGFLRQQDGHFSFADGTRVRFFGLNLAKKSVFIDKGTIDQLAVLFSRSGINLVRLHQLDDVGGILDPAQPGGFDAHNLDIVDYWIARMKERGIYINLDLDDYRTFHAAEGVPSGEQLGRGAKPYVVFDQRLIELQQDYAKRLLVTHINPYTKLAYAADPAIALLEIYDENGLFIRRDDWQTLVEPYQTELLQQWNTWLRYRYRTTAALKAAWTDYSGGCALIAGESLEQATVKLPVMTLSDSPPRDVADPLLAPARVSDGAQFAYETQSNFLQVMINYLHGIGVVIPVTAVGAQEVLPDQMATAATCDYIGINFYWDHPGFLPGNAWHEPFYCNLSNPLLDNPLYSFPAYSSLSHMAGKPLIIRELNYCYPNLYRGAGMLEAAAYGALLDFDALILFTYDDAPANQNIGYFDIHLDPLRWGLVGQASRLFRSGEVKTAPHSVGIGYTPVDAFIWRSYRSPLYQLSESTKVLNTTTVSTLPQPFDLLVTSGRSNTENWSGGKILFFTNQRQADLHNQVQGDGLERAFGYHLQTETSDGAQGFYFQGLGFDNNQQVSLSSWLNFSAADLMAQMLQPQGLATTASCGFEDTRQKILGFHNLPEDIAARFALDALHEWSQSPVSHSDIDQNHYRGETGQIDRDLAASLLRIDTPTIQCLAGKFNNAGGVATSALKLITPTAIGTLTAESLDQLPLAQSATFLVKMTSRADNTGTDVQPVVDGPCAFKIVALGLAPVTTAGLPTPTPSHVELNGKLLLEVSMQDGTWEYLATPARALLYLDTPNITVTFPRQPARVRFYSKTGVAEITPTSASIQIPAGVSVSEIVW